MFSDEYFVDMTINAMSQIGKPCSIAMIREEIFHTDDFLDFSTVGTSEFNISEREFNNQIRRALNRLRNLGFVCRKQQTNNWKLTDEGGEQLNIGKASHVNKLKSAWLITREGTDTYYEENKLYDDQNRLVALIRGNRSSKFVREIMEIQYCGAMNSAHWYARHISRTEEMKSQQFGLSGGYICGHSSLYLYGRRVSDLITRIEHGELYETIEWKEPDIWQQNPETYQLEFVKTEEVKKIRRRTLKVGSEMFENYGQD